MLCQQVLAIATASKAETLCQLGRTKFVPQQGVVSPASPIDRAANHQRSALQTPC